MKMKTFLMIRQLFLPPRVGAEAVTVAEWGVESNQMEWVSVFFDVYMLLSIIFEL